jgi:uncharacterized protein
MAPTVSHLRASPVKGLLQTERDSLTLDADGIVDDRRFVIVDTEDNALYGADLAVLAGATSRWDVDADLLTIRFADGEEVTAAVTEDTAREGRAYGGRRVPGVDVTGPWAAAITARAGRPLRLIRAPVGLGSPGPLTLLGDASIARVAQAVGVEALDPRRFKTSIEIAGLAPYDEDGWTGRDVRIGDAMLRVGGQVPRCVLTTRDPDTQRPDHDVLRAILSHRPRMATGEAPLAVYATVVTPGVIRRGDPVVPVL